MTEEITKKITEGLPKESIDAYTRYYDRIPLNEELAAVQRGEIGPVEQDAMPKDRAVQPVPDPPFLVKRAGELTRDDRLALRELKQSDGWLVVMQLLKKRCQDLEKRAITISRIDPWENKEAIAKEWMYAGAFEQALTDIEMLVNAELKILWEQEQ